MLKIIEGIDIIMEEDNVKDQNRKPIIFEKVKNIVENQSHEDLLLLNKIYYKNIKLSCYIPETEKDEFIKDISQKINSMKNKKEFIDFIDYIKIRYYHKIQAVQIGLSNK